MLGTSGHVSRAPARWWALGSFPQLGHRQRASARARIVADRSALVVPFHASRPASAAVMGFRAVRRFALTVNWTHVLSLAAPAWP